MKKKKILRESTRQLVVALEKTAKKNKAAVFKDLASYLQKPRRQATSVDLWKLNKMAAKFKDKTLVVPGKVLGTGELTETFSLAAFAYSESAKAKLEKAKIKPLGLNDILEKPGKELVIIR